MTLELAPVDDERRAEALHSWYWELLTDQNPPTTLEELIGERPSWEARAACKGMGGQVNFFPERGEAIEPARAICEWCGVRQECLEYIMAAEPGAPGIWGGTTERGRRKLRRARG